MPADKEARKIFDALADAMKDPGKVALFEASLKISAAQADHAPRTSNVKSHCGETDCTFQDGWCECGMEG